MRAARLKFHVLAIATLAFALVSTIAISQETPTDENDDTKSIPSIGSEIRSVRTDSPRETLKTFFYLRDSMEDAVLRYSHKRTADEAEHIFLLSAQFRALLDLSDVAQAIRADLAAETNAYLLDILGRVATPALDTVPDAESFADETGFVQYRIPGTPIRITRIEEGSREGEYLFDARTVRDAPRFYRAIEHLPLRSRLGIKNWHIEIPQFTGPLIPTALIAIMPERLRNLWLNTPIWKVVLMVLSLMICFCLLILFHRRLSRTESNTRFSALGWRLTRPVSLVVVFGLLIPFIDRQVNTSGDFSRIVDTTITGFYYLSAAWLFWLVVRLFFEWLILSPRIADESLDANLLRLIAGTIGLIGIIIILAYGAQKLGVPVMSMLAGLGIGGLAIALAIKPTLENLIGGIILYVDKPVRVGDFCTFGAKTGTVESIGIRSTQLRALDRTLITVPNAQFADLEIVNWAKCDEMLINETIGVRYETKPDQLRYALAKLREMLHAHPRINSESIRVRFSGYGDCSLNLTIRVYAMTREWNDFHAIREDIFLRIYDIITEAGTGFAFPSQTIYMGKDDGLNEKNGRNAEGNVQAWRRSGELPFPRFSKTHLESIDGKLDYPPKGSPEAGQEDLQASAGSEGLSARLIPPEQADRETQGQHENDGPSSKSTVKN